MRALSADFRARLETGVTSLCHAWRVARADGAVLGFTDHDCDIVLDGLMYRSAVGLAARDGEKALTLGADRGGIVGALSSDAIDAADLARGLWDGARVDLWRVDWAAPQHRAHIAAGRIGAVRTGPQAFEVELVGLDAVLAAPFGRVFSRFCDANLGDARCGVDLEDPAFRGVGSVDVVRDARTFTATGLGVFADGWFTRGRIVFTAGGAAEVAAYRVHGEVTTIEIAAVMPLDAGAAFTITAGCDKHFATCRAKFANVAAFRGFPHMPGNDAMLAGPDARVPMDGGSRFR